MVMGNMMERGVIALPMNIQYNMTGLPVLGVRLLED
jgi:hypothetical protein